MQHRLTSSLQSSCLHLQVWGWPVCTTMSSLNWGFLNEELIPSNLNARCAYPRCKWHGFIINIRGYPSLLFEICTVESPICFYAVYPGVGKVHAYCCANQWGRQIFPFLTLLASFLTWVI
jgi:hypothetical protein